MYILIIKFHRISRETFCDLKKYDHGNVGFEVLMEGSMKFDLILRSHTVAVV